MPKSRPAPLPNYNPEHTTHNSPHPVFTTKKAKHTQPQTHFEAAKFTFGLGNTEINHKWRCDSNILSSGNNSTTTLITVTNTESGITESFVKKIFTNPNDHESKILEMIQQSGGCESIIRMIEPLKAKEASGYWMRYYNGLSLEKLITTKKLSIEHIYTILKGLINALHYLHTTHFNDNHVNYNFGTSGYYAKTPGNNNPLIHGDIKTANVLTLWEHNVMTGSVLSDLGTTESCASRRTHLIDRSTISITAPESHNKNRVIAAQNECKQDIYQLGILLLECLTSINSATQKDLATLLWHAINKKGTLFEIIAMSQEYLRRDFNAQIKERKRLENGEIGNTAELLVSLAKVCCLPVAYRPSSNDISHYLKHFEQQPAKPATQPQWSYNSERSESPDSVITDDSGFSSPPPASPFDLIDHELQQAAKKLPPKTSKITSSNTQTTPPPLLSGLRHLQRPTSMRTYTKPTAQPHPTTAFFKAVDQHKKAIAEARTAMEQHQDAVMKHYSIIAQHKKLVASAKKTANLSEKKYWSIQRA